MFFTPPLFVWTAVFSDVQLDLCFPRPEAASSSASCSFKACKTGLNVKLPSGVVGAVEISNTPSSKSMLEEGIEGCLYMVAIKQRSNYKEEQRQD